MHTRPATQTKRARAGCNGAPSTRKSSPRRWKNDRQRKTKARRANPRNRKPRLTARDFFNGLMWIWCEVTNDWALVEYRR